VENGNAKRHWHRRVLFSGQKPQWMINFRVTDLDAMTEQLRANGNDVEVDKEVYSNGRFAIVHDTGGCDPH